MTTVVINSDEDDGTLSKANVDYTICRESNTGFVNTVLNHFDVGQFLFFGFPVVYSVMRSGLFFDTSTIPATAIIDNANLRFVLHSDYSNDDFDIVIQNGQPDYPHKPMEVGDYDLVHYSDDGGSFNTSSLPAIGNNFTIDLNVTGISWINIGGITKFLLRSSNDISATAPIGDEYIYIYSFEEGTTYIPTLNIDYHLPFIPSSKKFHISSSNENIYNIESKNEHNLNIMKRER